MCKCPEVPIVLEQKEHRDLRLGRECRDQSPLLRRHLRFLCPGAAAGGGGRQVTVQKEVALTEARALGTGRQLFPEPEAPASSPLSPQVE
jgi:hypothetical protein